MKDVPVALVRRIEDQGKRMEVELRLPKVAERVSYRLASFCKD